MVSNLWVASAANSTDPNGFGGLPYYLVETGRRLRTIEGGFAFDTNSSKVKFARLVWNAEMFIKTGKHGGFQYSENFLQLLWNSAPRPKGRIKLLNIFQLFPKQEMERNSEKYFYLDQTLDEVFDFYGSGQKLPREWRKDIRDRERTQYLAANRIIFRSNWAAQNAILKYGLPEDKVRVVLPGANIPHHVLKGFDNERPQNSNADGSLKMIFIGKEWRRKGLDRLLAAMQIANVNGERLSLTVVGTGASKELARLAHGLDVRWIPFFDKATDPTGFARLVASFDIGVLLSRSEAGGVSLREFGRLGLPVIAPLTGGSPEFAMSEHSELVAPSATNQEIAEILIRLSSNRGTIQRRKNIAWERRKEFGWDAAVLKLAEAL